MNYKDGYKILDKLLMHKYGYNYASLNEIYQPLCLKIYNIVLDIKFPVFKSLLEKYPKEYFNKQTELIINLNGDLTGDRIYLQKSLANIGYTVNNAIEFYCPFEMITLSTSETTNELINLYQELQDIYDKFYKFTCDEETLFDNVSSISNIDQLIMHWPELSKLLDYDIKPNKELKLDTKFLNEYFNIKEII